GEERIAAPPPYAVRHWTATTDNLVTARGTVTLAGAPVIGARIRVDGFDVPAPTDAEGRFAYLADATQLARHVVTVIDSTHARVGGRALTRTQRAALAADASAITVSYPIRGVKVARDASGRTVVT